MFTAITASQRANHVVLLDIPGSIEDAQGHGRRILSGPPPTQPYPSTEPKGQKLVRALSAIAPDQLQRERLLETELVSALELCKARFHRYGIPWCLARFLQDEGDVNDARQRVDGPFDHRFRGISVVLSPLNGANTFSTISEIRHAAVLNPSCSETALDVDGSRYLIPAKSAFVLSSIRDGMCGFKAAAESFDLIIMDPPWTNRSVRRSQTYKTHEDQQDDPFVQTLPVLKEHLKEDGLVTVWVTNKPAVRVQVLEALRLLGLELQAEWVYLKVTTGGGPVTSIHGVWRKPYESLLIFANAKLPRSIPQHMIIAVPDLHSRKPSLKRLLEQYLPSSYAALELFARSLTAGWWSWGDQVLMFQDSRQWMVTNHTQAPVP